MVGMLRVVIYLIAVQLEQFFWSLQRTWKKIFFFFSLSDLFQETTNANQSLVTILRVSSRKISNIS